MLQRWNEAKNVKGKQWEIGLEINGNNEWKCHLQTKLDNQLIVAYNRNFDWFGTVGQTKQYDVTLGSTGMGIYNIFVSIINIFYHNMSNDTVKTMWQCERGHS